VKIVITSKKGGATKSTQAKEIAFRFNLPIINLDIDSHIKDYYPKLNIVDAKENELIPVVEKGVYDFPAGDIFKKFPNIESIIKGSDLIIIPTLYASESVDRAIDTYRTVSKHNDNILFIVSQTKDKGNIKDTKDYIEASVATEVAIMDIRFSLGMGNAEDNGRSIFEEADKANKLIARNYKKGILADYDELFDIIEMVMEDK